MITIPPEKFKKKPPKKQILFRRLSKAVQKLKFLDNFLDSIYDWEALKTAVFRGSFENAML